MKRTNIVFPACGAFLLAVSILAFKPGPDLTTKPGNTAKPDPAAKPAPDHAAPAGLDGAWQIKGNPRRVAIIVDGYFALTTFRENEPEFISTMGGPLSWENGSMSGTIEFNSDDQQQVGENFTIPAKLEGEQLTVTREGGIVETWERVDEAENELAGVWRITQRENDGQMNEMPLRARRTLKILSGTRFQWAAINVETGEFSGTGGGTYTFEDGVYTENIEFFSRDNSRVGMSLSFEGEVKDDDWHHKGKSSKGDPIYEVWSKFENN